MNILIILDKGKKRFYFTFKKSHFIFKVYHFTLSINKCKDTHLNIISKNKNLKIA